MDADAARLLRAPARAAPRTGTRSRGSRRPVGLALLAFVGLVAGAHAAAAARSGSEAAAAGTEDGGGASWQRRTGARALLATTGLGITSVRTRPRPYKKLGGIARKFGVSRVQRHKPLFTASKNVPNAPKGLFEMHDGSMRSAHFVAHGRHRARNNIEKAHGKDVAKSIDGGLFDPDRGAKPKGHGYLHHLHKLSAPGKMKHSKDWHSTVKKVSSGKPDEVARHAKWLANVERAQTDTKWQARVARTGAHHNDHLAAHHRTGSGAGSNKARRDGRAAIGKLRGVATSRGG